MSELHSSGPVLVAVCETQPLTADGVSAALNSTGEFRVVLQASSLDELRILARHAEPHLAIVDKATGTGDLREWLEETTGALARLATKTIVWGTVVTEAETVKLMHSGVRGVLRKSASRETLLSCVHSVVKGQRWMEEGVLQAKYPERPHSELTPREEQVMKLVQTGLRNWEIAFQLGIRPGAVKIHLKHIFEKTGIRGRYGLALGGLQELPASNSNGHGPVNGYSEMHGVLVAD